MTAPETPYTPAELEAAAAAIGSAQNANDDEPERFEALNLAAAALTAAHQVRVADVRERLDAIRKLCEARLRVVGMVDGKGDRHHRQAAAVSDRTALALGVLAFMIIIAVIALA